MHIHRIHIIYYISRIGTRMNASIHTYIHTRIIQMYTLHHTQYQPINRFDLPTYLPTYLFLVITTALRLWRLDRPCSHIYTLKGQNYERISTHIYLNVSISTYVYFYAIYIINIEYYIIHLLTLIRPL